MGELCISKSAHNYNCFYMDAYVRLLQNAKIFIEIEQHYSVLIIFALLLVKDKNKSKEEK